ncbi:MAG TPA: helix-turn-helix domain-containing protein [Isosphaeraceae bacterium]|jgi:DNA-binding XRE family transcriptional regulator|nr:helix-turn-helix domain-containing protein [Isosphaeraceae bacterium]
MGKTTPSKPELTAEQKAAIKPIREQSRREQPRPDELVARGEIDEPIPHGQFLELMALVAQLKTERKRRGLSLTDLSARSGLTRSAISRLENGWNQNPTLVTLYRYAQSMDLHICIALKL